jgi:hypothetical protein
VPNLLTVNLFELARKVLTVTTVELERSARLNSVAHALLELLKDRPVRSLEDE